ncbi:MAG: hypothetical protein GF411_08570 [Candidatus Lokiarchaeota archaeon]|nr:hypothetical protein [Candidatus Lokiarchaeota archaeon]
MIDNEAEIGWEILYDLCIDLPYSVIFDLSYSGHSNAIIESSDPSKPSKYLPRTKKAHIDVIVDVQDATIKLKSMADYRRNVIEGFVDLEMPDYREKFQKSIDDIVMIRKLQFVLGEHEAFIDNIKREVNDLLEHYGTAKKDNVTEWNEPVMERNEETM